MKKIYAFLFAAGSLSLFSQSSIQIMNVAGTQTYAANSTIHLQSVDSDNVKFTLDIKNISGSKQSYVVRRYDIALHTVPGDQAKAYFCFAGNCYGTPTIESPDTLKLVAGDKASNVSGSYQMLTADLDETQSPTVGFSYIKYTFKNTAVAGDSLQINVKYNDASAVGIKTTEKELVGIDIFPNPTKGPITLKLSSNKSFNTNILVFNSLGQAVISKEAAILQGKNKLSLDTDNLPAGVYFVTVKTNETTVSKKLIIE